MENITHKASSVNALETLKQHSNWVFWKEEERKEGDKPTKILKNCRTGYNASSTNKNTWSDFMTAVKGNKDFGGDGLGWVFTKDAGIVGVDLDDCIGEDGQVAEWALHTVSALNSYTEISPSGKGLHIFLYGQIKRALGPTPETSVEVYGWGRYFTMTGNHLPESPLTISSTSQRQLDILWQQEHDQRQSKSKLENNATLDTTGLAAYITKSYQEEITCLISAIPGHRNDTLNRVTFNLGQFVEAGHLPQTDVEAVLLSLAVQLGLSDREAGATIASGIKGAFRNPRKTWPDFDEVGSGPAEVVTTPSIKPGTELVYHQKLNEGNQDAWLKTWGLVDETISQFRLGYCNVCPTSPYSDSITVPYYVDNKLVDIRHILTSPNGNGIYRPEVEGIPLQLFNLDILKSEDHVILVEGELQAMILCQYLVPAIGIPGEAPSFKAVWAKRLKGCEVYVALNMGKGKEKIARRICDFIVMCGGSVKLLSFPVTPSEFFTKFNGSLGGFYDYLTAGRVI